MAITFPASPSVGDVFANSTGVWEWDGTAWRVTRQADLKTQLEFGQIDFGGAALAEARFINAIIQTILTTSGIPNAMGMLGFDVLCDVPTFHDGTAVQRLGFLNIPQNSKSANYQLVMTDAGKQIFHPSSDTTARTWTIPDNALVPFPIGTAVTFVNQNGAGTITIATQGDVMRLAGSGTTGNRTLAANGMATALKVTATEWLISGTGLN